MAGKIIEPRVNIPKLIEQGDTVTWVDQPFTDDQSVLYNAAGFTLTYTLAGVTAPLNVVAAAQGVGWLTTLTASQTGALTPGQYWWQATLSGGGVVVTVARGDLRVVANLANQSAGYSGLSTNEQNLKAAEAQLAAVSSTESYRIGDREMRYRMTKDIQDTIAYWNAKVINEKTANSIAQNQGNPRKLYARFPSRFGSGS